MRRTRKPHVVMTKLIVDARDGRKDRQIPLSKAKELYTQMLISYDVTNGAYCLKKPTDKFVLDLLNA